MTVESAQFITQLNQDYPENSATISKNLAQHINLVKGVVTRCLNYNQEVQITKQTNNIAHLTANMQAQINSRINDNSSVNVDLSAQISAFQSNEYTQNDNLSAALHSQDKTKESNNRADLSAMQASTQSDIAGYSAWANAQVRDMSASARARISSMSASINTSTVDVSGTAYAAIKMSPHNAIFFQTATPAGAVAGDLWMMP